MEEPTFEYEKVENGSEIHYEKDLENQWEKTLERLQEIRNEEFDIHGYIHQEFVKKEKEHKRERKPLYTKYKKGDFITVKTSLKSVLKDHDKNFMVINDLVCKCNDIVIKTYQFIRLYILYCFHNNKEIPLFNKDNILYFIRACGKRDNRGKKSKNEDLQKELEKHFLLLCCNYLKLQCLQKGVNLFQKL
jgi:hypothetical protein